MSFDGVLLRGTSAFTTGLFGQALSGGVYRPASIGTFATATMECRVKITDTTHTAVALGGDNGVNSPPQDPWIGIVNGKAAYQVPGVSASTTTTTTIGDGAWHHLAMTFDGTNVKLWVDGVLANSTASTASLRLDGFMGFGGFGSTPNTSFDWHLFSGLIDEIRFSSIVRYTTTFTPSSTAFADDANTIALYHLDGNATDSHGQILANDANIVYSPTNWGASGTSMKTINPGAYCRFLVNGSGLTSVTLFFSTTNDLTPVPQVAYRIDGGAWSSQAIASSISVAVPSTNIWTKHLVEFRVKSMTETQSRWSTTSTEVVFTGFATVGVVGTTVAISQRARTVVAFGDSITEGVRTLGNTQTNDTDRNDAAQGWAYQLGELLDAEVGVVGFGGQGIEAVGSGSVPALPSSYNLLWGSGPSRSLTGVDLIIINEGTNDSATGSTTFTNDYKALLNTLLTAAPSAKIAALRPFGGTHASDVQAAVAACTDPIRAQYVDTTGMFTTADSSDSVHPYGYANTTKIAPALAAALDAILNPTQNVYVNVGGVASAVGAAVKL